MADSIKFDFIKSTNDPDPTHWEDLEAEVGEPDITEYWIDYASEKYGGRVAKGEAQRIIECVLDGLGIEFITDAPGIKLIADDGDFADYVKGRLGV